MSKGENIPVYKLLVQNVRAGFLALDEPVQKEITTFLKSQQHANGGFVDRAQTPDLYYSLFGLWLSMATEEKELQNNLRKNISEKAAADTTSPVEDLALLLLKAELNPNSKKKGIYSIIKTVLKKGRLIELSYQFFLVSLVIDAAGKNKSLFYFFARIWLFFYKPKGNIPCSLRAALLFARKMVGLKVRKMEKQLLGFANNSGGFSAFETMETSDGLSTGVALFVLNEIGTDLRMIRPECLDFVGANYFEGAFLSGDGDLTKDLEYTFYGLLALGALLKDEG